MDPEKESAVLTAGSTIAGRRRWFRGLRDGDRTGLAWFSVEATDGAAYDAALARLKTANAPLIAAAGGIETADPFGTRVRVLKAA
jgi:catechol-2,3-dioxygenase